MAVLVDGGVAAAENVGVADHSFSNVRTFQPCVLGIPQERTSKFDRDFVVRSDTECIECHRPA